MRKQRIVKIIIVVLAVIISLLIAFFDWAIIVYTHDAVIEFGNKVTLNDIIDEDIEDYCEFDKKQIDEGQVKDYNISIICFGFRVEKNLSIVDTTPPTLEVKNFETYKKDVDVSKFIESVDDNSEYTVFLIGEIDYDSKEEQKLIVSAKDIYNNETKKEVTLLFTTDSKPPKITGVGNKTVTENAKINWLKGVSAIDEVDGECKVSVDSSKVNLSTEGVYYATYTASDLSGNKTTVKRKIVVVKPTPNNEKLADFYEKYLEGKSVREMAIIIRRKINYSHNSGGSDPTGYALKYRNGSCRVHAKFFKSILDYAGYENMIIVNKSGSHMWNLVYENGVWRHYDSTPGNAEIGPNTDKEIERSVNRYKKWDKSKYPKAV